LRIDTYSLDPLLALSVAVESAGKFILVVFWILKISGYETGWDIVAIHIAGAILVLLDHFELGKLISTVGVGKDRNYGWT
jgi:hypothetical protein